MTKKIQHIYLLSLLLVLISGCIADETLYPEVLQPKDDKVQIELFAGTGLFATPVTRAGANEDDIDNIWVIVFTGDDNNADFVEVVEADMTGSSPKIILTKQPTACRLLILANPEDHIFIPYQIGPPEVGINPLTIEELRTYISTQTTGKLGDVCGLLSTTPVTNPFTTPSSLPFTGDHLPMSYLYEATGGLNFISKIELSDGSPLPLERAVAKVVVAYEEIAVERKFFTFHGITAIVNAPRQGLWYRLDDEPEINDPANPNKIVEYKYENYIQDIVEGDENQSTISSPIYIYESKTDNGNPGNTYIIIRGYYREEDDSGLTIIEGDYYYKMDLVNNNGQPLSVLRNNAYTFIIKSVKARGYETPEDAQAANASNVNLDYEIQVTDLTAYEIVANNDYYVAVSNSELLAYVEGGDTSYDAFTLTTNCTHVFSDAFNVITTTSPGLEIISPENGKIIQQDNQAVQPITVQIKMSESFTSGYIQIRLGNIVKGINVKRMEPVSTSGTGSEPLVFCTYNYKTGGWGWYEYDYYLSSATIEDEVNNDWIKLSTGSANTPTNATDGYLRPLPGIKREGLTTLFSEDGQIQIHVEGGVPITEPGVVYMATTKNPGWTPPAGTPITSRIKVLLTRK